VPLDLAQAGCGSSGNNGLDAGFDTTIGDGARFKRTL